MRLREYHAKDAWAIAEIEALCNLTDPLAQYYRRNNTYDSHGDNNSRDDERNWTSYVSSCKRFQGMKRLLPGTICHVLEETNDMKIVGFTIWTRVGNDQVAKQWQRPGRRWLTRLQAAVHYLTIALYFPFDSNLNHRHVLQVQPLLKQPPAGIKLPAKRWELNAMYIHPQSQRRGYGMQALQWGLDQASRGKIPVVLQSTAKGYGLYHKAGFRSISKLDFRGLFEPGEPGMHLMIWELKSVQLNG